MKANFIPSKNVIKTKISLLRSDGLGLEGTYANVRHHAEAIKPFVDNMKNYVGKLGFAEWKQGHNIHEFYTVEGTRYTLRAFQHQGKYVGIRLSLRVSRSMEVRLVDIVDPEECWGLLEFMESLAQPAKGDLGRLDCNNVN